MRSGVSAAGAARSACRPSGSACPRSRSAACTRRGQLQPVAAQQPVHHRLDLQLPENHADALVRAAAERVERIAMPLVFGAVLGEPLRVELVGSGQSSGSRWFMLGQVITMVPAGR